jgi:radical SAM superfamily enzyme YgiQ (UPF0313 family)
MIRPKVLPRPGRRFRALLVHPEFTSESFWNYRETCKLAGARYAAIPLGLLTVAALLPQDWDFRLVDCNVRSLDDRDLRWADLVFVGGMISQQLEILKVVERAHEQGKRVVVGGTDATSNPEIYGAADHLVLNEAEITLPPFLRDLVRGEPGRVYRTDRMADITKSPVPRYDLIRLDDYLHASLQYSRGCPFSCEFCDIIELFGRRPRLKKTRQVLAELQRLYDLGYRGHVDFVDDNFIGNKREVKSLLTALGDWLRDHHDPFEFSTEASINLARDDELLRLMQETRFSVVFIGIETPDEDILRSAGKYQALQGSLARDIEKICRHGMFVNAGFIIGFDSEKSDVARGIIDCIEETSIPVAMVGLLSALPNTQLTRRLEREGRLLPDYDRVHGGDIDQCTGGLNFVTVRDRAEILGDYYRVVDEVYAPKAYFRRVRRTVRMLDETKKKLRLPLRILLQEFRFLMGVVWSQGFRARHRWSFWRTVLGSLLTNPRAFRYSIALASLYCHLGPYSRYLKAQIAERVEQRERPIVTYPRELLGASRSETHAIVQEPKSVES